MYHVLCNRRKYVAYDIVLQISSFENVSTSKICDLYTNCKIMSTFLVFVELYIWPQGNKNKWRDNPQCVTREKANYIKKKNIHFPSS